MSDVALRPIPGKASTWEVVKVRLGRRSPLRRRQSLPGRRLGRGAPLFATTEAAAEAARLRDMHPSDVAHLVRNLPLPQRRQLAEAMEDERLADVLEELSEAEQLRLIEGLDLDRLVVGPRGDGVRRRRRPAGRDARRAAQPRARRPWTRTRPACCAASSPTARAPPAA